jgi:hypothetical protein
MHIDDASAASGSVRKSLRQRQSEETYANFLFDIGNSRCSKAVALYQL